MSNQMRRLMRRMGAGGNQQTRGGLYLPQGAYSPEDEQDRRRDALAERLLEIGLEDTRIGDFTDCHRREPVTKEGGEVAYHEDIATLTLEEWFVKLAHAALAAAELVYPEIPSADDAPMIWRGKPPAPAGWVLPEDLPAAAQEGARTVANLADDGPARGEG